MKILRITDLRKWAKENGYSDSWYYSIDGAIPTEKVKIGQVPRDGNVNVLNADIQNPSEEDWIRFRYPDYETPEEIKEREERERRARAPWPDQVADLEFFGIDSEGVDKDQASELLRPHRRKMRDEGRYDELKEYRWKVRHKIYEGAELFYEWMIRFRDVEFYLRESFSEEKMRTVAEQAHQQGIEEKNFLNYLRQNHPQVLLAESTRKKKISEANWHKRDYGTNYTYVEKPRNKSSNSGCLGVILLLFIPIIAISASVKIIF